MSADAATELTCRELVDLVTEYLEDALPDDERSRFEHHLAACSGCRAYLRNLRATIRTAGRLSERDLPGEVREALLHTFRAWKAGGKPA